MAEITPRKFIQVPIETLKGMSLNSTDKLVFGTIYTMLNVMDKCFMSNAKIAEGIEMKPHTVSNSISKLCKLGLLKTRNTYKGDSPIVDKRYIEFGDQLNGRVTNITRTSHKNDTSSHNNDTHVSHTLQENKLTNKLTNIYSSSSNSETSENPYELYYQITGRNLTGTQQPKMIDFIKTDGSELVVSALKTAQYIAKQSDGKANYGLFDSVIHEWEDEGIKTVGQAREYEKQRLQDKHERMNKSRQAYQGHHVIDNEFPDYMKEEYDPKSNQVDEAEKQRVLAKLAKLKENDDEN